MTKKIVDKEKSELRIKVVAEKKDWTKHIDEAFVHMKKKLTLKGFRKGQVPDAIARKHLSNKEIWGHALGHILDDLVKVAAKEIDEKDFVLDGPTYKVEKLTATELEVTFIYPLYPEVKNLKYKNVGVKYVEPKFDKKLVDEEIKKIKENNSMNIVKDSSLAKGDVAKFDFEGFVDDKPFEGGKAENYELEIGSGQFIKGFEEQMIGMKKDDSKDIKVTFPKEYHVSNLAGKDAVFKVKLNEVFTKTASKLDDDGVAALAIPNVKTLNELKAYIEKVFKEQQAEKAKSEFQKEIFAKIKEEIKVAIPPTLVIKEREQLKKSFEAELAKSKVNLQQYMKMTGLDEVKLDAQFTAQARERLLDSFIFAEIAKLEKIELTDKDYDKEYKKIAKVYNTDEKSIKGMIKKSQIQIPLTNTKVLELLIKENK